MVVARRWLVGLVGAALLAPVLLYPVFARQARRLDALADHGQTGGAFVTDAFEQLGVDYVRYAWTVDGVGYDWTVGRDELPFAVGQPVVVTWLPEDPSLGRPGPDRAVFRADADESRQFGRYAALAASTFFLVNAGLVLVRLRRSS